MMNKPFLIHALSPLHAGTGQAADAIDLPIARMRATLIPILPGSSIKGVLRDARQGSGDLASERKDTIWAVFGPDTFNASENAGALVVGDAILLALPVRSFRGTFAWVTSPMLLALARRDLGDGWPDIPAQDFERAQVASVDGASKSLNIHGSGKDVRVYLEDLDMEVTASPSVREWASRLADAVVPEHKAMFERRFLVVPDERMAFFWETCTQVDTRIRLNSKTRTVDTGALWTEESLPSESLLLGLLAADCSRKNKVEMSPAAVLDVALGTEAKLQFGGKASIGRGRCRMIPLLTGKA